MKTGSNIPECISTYGPRPEGYTTARHQYLLEKSGLSADERKILDEYNYYLLGPIVKFRIANP